MAIIIAGVFASLAPQRRRLLIGLVALLAALAVGTTVAVLWRGTTKPVSQAAVGPVFLVPGYGGSTTGLEILAAYLRAHGREATVVSVPDHGYTDFDEQAQALAAAVGDRPSVDLVGYSDGGVVARTWVRDHGGARRARRVVTLSSPHHGTNLAGLATNLGPDSCPTACQQIEPDSGFLNRLNAGDETPAGPQWVSIWTTNDQVVVPPTSARLSGATNVVVQDVCPADAVDHGGMPTDPVVQQIVGQELDGTTVTAQPTVTCGRPSS